MTTFLQVNSRRYLKRADETQHGRLSWGAGMLGRGVVSHSAVQSAGQGLGGMRRTSPAGHAGLGLPSVDAELHLLHGPPAAHLQEAHVEVHHETWSSRKLGTVTMLSVMVRVLAGFLRNFIH